MNYHDEPRLFVKCPTKSQQRTGKNAMAAWKYAESLAGKPILALTEGGISDNWYAHDGERQWYFDQATSDQWFGVEESKRIAKEQEEARKFFEEQKAKREEQAKRENEILQVFNETVIPEINFAFSTAESNDKLLEIRLNNLENRMDKAQSILTQTLDKLDSTLALMQNINKKAAPKKAAAKPVKKPVKKGKK